FKFRFGLDLVFLAGFLFVFLALLRRDFNFIYLDVLNKYFIVASLILICSIVVTILQGVPSLEYLSFAAKIFLYSIFALFVVDLYCSFYQAVFLDKIILHLYVAILIHAF